MRLTPALQEQIGAFIRAGGYPHVAAAAAGVPEAVFTEWVQRGRASGAREPYRGFVLALDQAVAQARLTAETKTFQDNPYNWLKYGPGKETPAVPGWTTTARAYPPTNVARTQPLADPVLRELLAKLLQALLPFPEAREAAGRIVEEMEKELRTD